MRDFIAVAEKIRSELKRIRGDSTRKREFYRQLGIFIRESKFYPPEARYPWDKLGHIIREYCSDFEPAKWQRIALEIVRDHGTEE